MKLHIFSTLFFSGLVFGSLSVVGCSRPQSGPDQTAVGALAGTGLGGAAGAIVGNQIGNVGEGLGVGAGLGLVAGAIEGAALDSLEETQVDQGEALASLKTQNLANAQELAFMQAQLDRAHASAQLAGTIHQVFFDADSSTPKAGSIANLETLAESIKRTPARLTIHIQGHSDDNGTPEYNEKLAESRARAVSSYLAARGISMDQIEVKSFGSTRPLLSNNTPTGQQLNRRVDLFVTE